MAVSSHLFRLIKSLSKSEKRHFRLSLGEGAADRNYLQLFRAIDAQREYDEAGIRRKFRDRAFTKQLHVAKNYLRQLILRSLRTYHGSISKEAELRDRVHEIEILFRRDLFDLCQRTITKAESTARRYEKYEILLDVLAWKRRLLLTRHGAFTQHEQLTEIAVDEADTLRRINVIADFQRQVIEAASRASSPADQSQAPIAVPALVFPDSLRLTILHAHLSITHQTFANKPDDAEQTLTQLVETLERHPHRIADDPEPYVTVLSNKVGFALRRSNVEEISALLADIRSVPERFPRKGRAPLSVRTVLRTYNIELELYRDVRDVERGITKIAEVQDYLQRHARSIPKDYELLFNYQFAHLCFLNKDYNASLRWLNEIIGGSWGGIRDDIQGTSRMLHLIIHYELGNISLLRYAVEACRRYFRKRRALETYERVLLRFFGNLSVSPKREHLALFAKVQRELFTTGQEKADANVLDYVDLKAWLSEKLGTA